MDVQNWEDEQETPGFLPGERAWFDKITGPIGFTDAFREANFGENQFTWWPDTESARRDQNGWRKDLQICTPGLRQYVVEARIEKVPQFGLHAAVMIEYELDEDE